jgi:hypothetical protein
MKAGLKHFAVFLKLTCPASISINVWDENKANCLFAWPDLTDIQAGLVS